MLMGSINVESCREKGGVGWCVEGVLFSVQRYPRLFRSAVWDGMVEGICIRAFFTEVGWTGGTCVTRYR